MKKAVFFDEDGPSFVAEDMNSRRKDVYRIHSPRFYESHRESPHFLQSCFLCKKTLSAHKDIFMYRGDKPFCSEDCRQEQIDIDDTKERMRNLSLKSSSRKEKAKSENYSSRTETMVAG